MLFSKLEWLTRRAHPNEPGGLSPLRAIADHAALRAADIVNAPER